MTRICNRCRQEFVPQLFPCGQVSKSCKKCRAYYRKRYHDGHKQQAKAAHSKWRERCLAEGGHKALLWCFRRLLSGYRRRTKINNLPPCDLTAEYLLELFVKQDGKCYYTNQLLDWNSYGKQAPSSYSMSVDRLVPQLGYTRGNTVLCTYFVNTAKGKLTEQEFYAFCHEVLENHKFS